MPAPADAKSANAFRTIGEVSSETGIAQHVLRYWERHFVQLRPITRAGNRRYYRPEDVALVVRIEHLLGRDGYTIRGVQRLFAAEGRTAAADPDAPVRAIRDGLKAALDADR